MPATPTSLDVFVVVMGGGGALVVALLAHRNSGLPVAGTAGAGLVGAACATWFLMGDVSPGGAGGVERGDLVPPIGVEVALDAQTSGLGAGFAGIIFFAIAVPMIFVGGALGAAFVFAGARAPEEGGPD